jgi:ATP-binding protein involved in chromosome partitioning
MKGDGNLDTREKILAALEKVNDPELHKNLIELGMVESVEIEGGSAHIVILLTTKKCPLKNKIGGDIQEEILKVEGVQEVHITYGEMDKEQKQALIEMLHGEKTKKIPLEGVNIVAVGSGKGGVGKSSVTAGLALTLAKKGYRVGLIDADILGYSIPRILNMEQDKSMMVSNGFILPIIKHGIKIISMGNLVDKNQAVVWRGPMIAKALHQFFVDVYWEELDYLLIDMPPGTGDVPLNVMEVIPQAQIVIVTTPEPLAREVSARLGLMAKRVGCNVAGVIENMSYFICDNCDKKHYLYGKGDSETLAKEMDSKLLGDIPLISREHDPHQDGRSFVLEGQENILESFSKIADELVQEISEASKREPKETTRV